MKLPYEQLRDTIAEICQFRSEVPMNRRQAVALAGDIMQGINRDVGSLPKNEVLWEQHQKLKGALLVAASFANTMATGDDYISEGQWANMAKKWAALGEDDTVLYSIPGGLGPIPRAMLNAEFTERMGEGTYMPKDPPSEAGSIFADSHTPA